MEYKARLKARISNFKFLLWGTLLFCALFFDSSQAFANSKYASIVIDSDTGVVLSERFADKKLHPASLTKAMTLMMMFDAINQGRVGLRDKIRISSHAASMVPSKLDIPIGSTIRVEDAILALVTKSANDVAAAMAEHLGGSESNFAKMMTAKAHKIGMKNTTFKNASGLHDPRQVTTARDMAIMARTLIHDYPRQYKYFSTRYFTYQGRSYRNHNRLMESYKGMDGLKTGYIAASGFNLVASAKRSDHRLIGVVFGGRTTHSRNAHMKKILDEGFKNIGQLNIASFENVPLPERKPTILLALASLNNIAPSAERRDRWASLNNGMFSQLVGEGDMDPVASDRIETGLMAIAAHTGEPMPSDYKQKPSNDNIRLASAANAMSSINDEWAIQIGAFTSRAHTDKVLGKAVLQLPDHLRKAYPVIVPTKRGESWLFRARLNGYSAREARDACRYLKDCITIRPAR